MHDNQTNNWSIKSWNAPETSFGLFWCFIKMLIMYMIIIKTRKKIGQTVSRQSKTMIVAGLPLFVGWRRGSESGEHVFFIIIIIKHAYTHRAHTLSTSIGAQKALETHKKTPTTARSIVIEPLSRRPRQSEWRQRPATNWWLSPEINTPRVELEKEVRASRHSC